ncbi:unnamed protein product [Soboliphyme baturini]|uniref:YTH domain-containing protein n=1 Tax=Soboliphyme baturini TaxID=241478 RepID=A0A183I9X7_9BILA|nr:unnamed protein product [Soboliphyme baturini]
MNLIFRFQSKGSLDKDRQNGTTVDDGEKTMNAVDNAGFLAASYGSDGAMREGSNGHYDVNGATMVGKGYDENELWLSHSGDYRLQNPSAYGGYQETFDSGYGHYGQFAPSYDPAGLYSDIYRQNMVDMNPAGGQSIGRDGSVHSSFSTPSQQKRVIREIIV